MEVRDPVHGSIRILDEEISIITHPFFQRLRSIKQLGFSEYVFPGATHTRFIHSLGVSSIGEKAFDTLFQDKLDNIEFIRLKETFKLACMLHDIGHAPLSHSTESVMPTLGELNLPDRFVDESALDKQATHEDYTIKSIVDSSFTDSFTEVKKAFGVDVNCIAELVKGETADPNYFNVDGINYFPILHQLVSSEMDCDRMDYLLRDSYFCGVSYGQYDLDWLLDNLEVCIINNSAFLGITERAVVTFDDFLLSRYHMFLMVYFHYRSVALEQLLFKYFATAPEEYSIPSDIEAYLEHDDHKLLKTLRSSSNKYAKAIVSNKIPEKIYESFNDTQLKVLEEIQHYLESQNIEYIRCSSSGRLSKYYTESGDSKHFHMKVVRKDGKGKTKSYFNIDEATDLFSKFSKSHAVNRLHCDLSEINPDQSSQIEKIMS